jgi:hypothetical protein
VNRFKAIARVQGRARVATLRPTSCHPRLPCLLLALSCTVAHAEIHRCPDRNAMPVYQNFPCDLDAPGAGSVSATTSALQSARSQRAPEGPTVKPAVPDPLSGSARAGRPAIPRPGMTMHQVRLLWGEPIEATTEEHAQEDVKVWSYAGARSVRFDRRGRVTAVHW